MVPCLLILQALLYSVVCWTERKEAITRPSKLVAYFSWLRVVPFNICYFLGFSELNPLLLQWIASNDVLTLENVTARYVAFNCLSFGLFWLTLRHVNFGLPRVSFKITQKQALLILTLGILSSSLFVSENGGVFSVITNLTSRVEMQSGSIYSKLRPLAVMGFLLFYHTGKHQRRNKPLYFILLTTVIGCLIITGGRKESLLFLAYIGLFEYHFSGKNLFKLNVRNVIASAIIGYFILLMPILRSANGLENAKATTIAEVVTNTGKISEYLNYSYIEMFVFSHFDTRNFWQGKSLLSLLSMFDRSLPSNERPPLDEGIYVTNMMRCNCHLEPAIPRSQLYATSYPLENVGTWYANGLLFGLIIGSILLGALIRAIHTVLVHPRDNGLGLFITLWFIFEFNFSVLRISSAVIFIASISFILLLANVWKIFQR